ncbi:MAG: hypothetical protein WA830_11860, partial [Candidatus Sulfotelmatobacter sp.]
CLFQCSPARKLPANAKCFGPKNCHAALDGRTENVLSCDPNGEPICGKELFKEFEYVLATTGISVKLE